MYKYIAVDFDGTILDSHHNINPKLVKLFKKLQQKGVIIIPASGRNISQMMSYIVKFNNFEYPTFIISDNGGTIYKMDDKLTKIKALEFNEVEVNFLNRAFSDKTRDFLLFKDGVCYYEKMSLRQRLLSKKFKRTLKNEITHSASKIIMIDNEQYIEEIYPKTKAIIKNALPTVNVFRSVPTLIEITPFGATKGNALNYIFTTNNFDATRLIAFGDGENDIDMLTYAAHGVAMSSGFASVRTVTPYLAKTNDENGVYQYLYDIYVKN